MTALVLLGWASGLTWSVLVYMDPYDSYTSCTS